MTAPSATTRHLRTWLGRALAVTWLGAFLATHVPAEKVPDVHVTDKTLHAVGYFVLATLLLAWLAARGVRRIRRATIAIVALAVYGAIDEATQPLVQRHASIEDWLADLAGVLAAAIVCELLLALFARPGQPPRT